jgi:hypothetical protein
MSGTPASSHVSAARQRGRRSVWGENRANLVRDQPQVE